MTDLNIGHPGAPPIRDLERSSIPQERIQPLEQQIGGPGPPPILDSPSQRFNQTDTVEISFLPPAESSGPVQQAEQIPRLDITV